MSIVQTIHNKMEFFRVEINEQPIVVDHIAQTSLYSGVGVLGEPGEITITAEAFRLLSKERMQYNPVGQKIEFMIIDPKSGERPYTGVVTSMTHHHGLKNTMVTLGFDKPHWVQLHKEIWWKCFDHKTILEIAVEFFNAYNVPVSVFPKENAQFRGTFWENFCTPINGPTLQYLMEELAKDNFIFYANPETGGVTIVNWSDIGRLDEIHKDNEDYIQDKIFAKINTKDKGWQQHTFTYGKQIDSELQWKIQEFSGNINPDLSTESKREHTFYSAIKKPQYFTESDGEEILPNDIQLQTVDNYPGTAFDEVIVKPYPVSDGLINQEDYPKAQYGAPWDLVTQRITHPRYMYYRMQQSYSNKIKLVSISMVIPGSAKAVVPLTGIPVSYFENARVEDSETKAEGDFWQSGFFLIWSSKLSIVGPNLLLTLNLVKPYH